MSAAGSWGGETDLLARVPDFRNQGIWLRLLLAANALMLLVALIGNRSLARLPAEITELAALVEPALLLVLALLFLLGPWLRRQPPYRAFLIVVVLAMAAMALMDSLLASLLGGTAGWRTPLAAGVGAALMLSWFSLRAQAQAPALAEARLAALNARIRPHFLFNSLNAILGVMREDPRRAEAALEELEQLVQRMETGELSLEESLKAFERGVVLTRDCQKALKDAELRVQALTETDAGLSLEDVDPDEFEPDDDD